MDVQVQTFHALNLAPEVTVHCADLDRLSTADREELCLGIGAAETKSICIIECVAHEVWHDDRQSNARVERPRVSGGSATRAQNKLSRSRRDSNDRLPAAPTRC